MKKYFIFLASAALVIAASCNKEEIKTTGETELITVQLNPETKTALGAEGTTTWTSGDAVDVIVDGNNVGTLSLVEGSTFSGELTTVGLNGEATLKYPAGVAAVPAEQEAVEGSFANGAALLEGAVDLDVLRAGEGATLANKTALLQFSVAAAGDVVFTVGEATYTVTGCEAGNTYYACVAPVEGAALSYTVAGTAGLKSKDGVTFEAGLAYELGTLDYKTTTVYMRPSEDWINSGNNFSAWVWADGVDGAWYSLSDNDSDGIYEVSFPVNLENIIFVSMKGDNDWTNSAAQTEDLKVPSDEKNTYIIYSGEWATISEASEFVEPEKVCKLTVRVNKSINWYDKYLYSWTSGTNAGSGMGVKLDWDKEDGNYYVYYHNFSYALNGKEIDFLLNNGSWGSGNQTNDLSVTLSENCTFTVEQSHVK